MVRNAPNHHDHEAGPRPGNEARGNHGDDGGHDKHEGRSPTMFRDKFWLSLILTTPVVYWSTHIEELLEIDVVWRRPATSIP